MEWIWHLNLIHLFNFYLGVVFLASTAMRLSQYHAILALVRSFPARWPRLFRLMTEHKQIFLTWATALPAILAFVVFAINLAASRLVWPSVNLTPGQLLDHWLVLPLIGVLGILMLGVDGYSTFSVGNVDRELMQKYFDQAEYWLRSWTAPVVRVFTFGFINPRQMVAVEVRSSLLEASKLINSTLWWVTVQVGLRIAFGLALWLTYALGTNG